jgi:hypothetical protein
MKVILSVIAIIFLVGVLAGPKESNTNSRPTSSAGARTSDQVSQSASRFMDDIHEKVIRDAEREYQMASRSGNDVDRCVHAGMVAAAHLQAHNQPSYQSWKMREEMDCHR